MIDQNRIVVLLRDVNGKRFQKDFQNVDDFRSSDWSWHNDENYEILLVLWGEHCIFNALTNEGICLEDLAGFFA